MNIKSTPNIIFIALIFIASIVSLFTNPIIIYAQEGQACVRVQQGQPIPPGTTICNNPSGCDNCPGGYECGGDAKCFSTQSGDAGVTGRRIQAAQEAWEGTWNNQTPNEWQYKAYVLGSDTTQAAGEATFAFLGNNNINFLASSAYVRPEIAAQLQAMGKPIPQGAINYLASGIGSMMGQKPAQTSIYLADLGHQAGIYNPVYAQDGTGFNALQPILKIWKAFRNMAYLMFVLIFVIIGFMIMFRTKVSQQAVISIQLALPQIIMTLLLITFSYAIAAFMIDLIYFLIYLIIAIFQTFQILDPGPNPPARDILLNKSLFGIMYENLITPGDLAGQASRAVGAYVEGAINADVIDNIIGGISSALAYLIFVVAIGISVFKLFFQLLISYIGLLVSTIFAPIILLFNAMPGSQSFSKWLKGIFANALVFPVAALMILLAASLNGEFDFGVQSDVGFNGSDGNTGGAGYKYSQIALPLIGGGTDTNALKAFIGIGFLMMMPKMIELVQKALGVEGGLGGMMGAIMEPIQAGYNKTAGGVVNAAGQVVKQGAWAATGAVAQDMAGKGGVRGKVGGLVRAGWELNNVFKGRGRTP